MKRPDTRTTPPGSYIFTQPETGIVFKFNTWAEIVENVAKHRRGNGLDLSDGWVDRLMHDICVQNLWWNCIDDEKPVSADTPLALAGRASWKALHEFADAYAETPTEDDISKARYWMSRWRETIPRFGGCNCREDWAKLENSYPPDYSSRDAFVRWASNSHDHINRRIGKPIFHPDWFNSSPAKDI